MRILLILLWALICLPTFAYSQTQIITKPYPVTGLNNVSTTITVTNTFQSLWIATTGPTGRSSCTVQNNSASNSMWVFFGVLASATKATSAILAPSQSLNCNIGNVILQTQVSITGTSGDAFYANAQ